MSIRYECFMSQLTPVREIKDSEKTTLSVVIHKTRGTCTLRVCKNRNLSELCEALKKITNPNIVSIHDYVYENGNTYILEENINGETLENSIKYNGVFSEKETARIILEVCKGLSDFHNMNPPIVHKDINTSNIMICSDSRVKLFDFDIARIYKIGNGQDTELFGTEEYAAPEHFGYGQSEPRTDIYSLGVTMHKMLTGKTLSPEHKSYYKGKLQKILDTCIEQDLKKRYASAKVLQKKLAQFLNRSKKRCVIFFNVILFLSIFAGTFFILYNQAERMLNDFIEDVFNDTSFYYEDEVADNITDTVNEGKDNGFYESDSDKATEASTIYEEDVLYDYLITNETQQFEDSDHVESSTNDEAEITDEDVGYAINNSVNEDISEPISNSSYGKIQNSNIATSNSKSALDSNGSENTKTTNSNLGESKKDTSQKNSTVAKYLDGELLSLVALNDNTIVYLEKTKEGYSLKNSSSDISYPLNFTSQTPHSYKLVYNYYTDQLYLISYSNSKIQINIINKDYTFDEEPVYINNGTYPNDKNYFFSDNILFADAFYETLIDCNSWRNFGDLSISNICAVLNDRIFLTPDYYSNGNLKEVDFNKNTISTYPIPFDTSYKHIEFSNNKYIFFMTEDKDKTTSVYRFDGEKFDKVACLNDYKYYTGSFFNKFCITDERIWAHDKTSNSIREFKIN